MYLRKCPFCGAEAVLYHQSSKYTAADGNYVYCSVCGSRTKLFECFRDTGKTHADTSLEAVEAWNTRYNDIDKNSDYFIITNPIDSNMFSNSACDNCPTNPKNGGNGICHCILGLPTIS